MLVRMAAYPWAVINHGHRVTGWKGRKDHQHHRDGTSIAINIFMAAPSRCKNIYEVSVKETEANTVLVESHFGRGPSKRESVLNAQM